MDWTQVELKYGKYFEVHEPTESNIFIAHTHLLRFKHNFKHQSWGSEYLRFTLVLHNLLLSNFNIRNNQITELTSPDWYRNWPI
jgi:hypothetical protein